MSKYKKYRMYVTKGITEVFEVCAKDEDEARRIICANKEHLKIYDEPYFSEEIDKIS